MKNELPRVDINRVPTLQLGQMFRDIEQFYSIVATIENSEYLGYQHLINKVSDKIDLLIAGEIPSPCDQLINKIMLCFENLKILTEFERQFPNYALSVILKEKDLGEIVIINSLKIRISLLSKFFTVFHEERTIHKGITYQKGTTNPVIINLLSSMSAIVDPDNNFFQEITNITQSLFVNHTFVGHEILFKRNLTSATPHGVMRKSIEEEFSLYSFLFDSEYQNVQTFYVAP